MKIEYFANPQGILRSDIEKQVSYLQSQAQLTDKVSQGKKFLDKIRD